MGLANFLKAAGIKFERSVVAQEAQADALGQIAPAVVEIAAEVRGLSSAADALLADAEGVAMEYSAPATVQQPYSLSLGGTPAQLTAEEVASYVGQPISALIGAFASRAGVTNTAGFEVFTVNGNAADLNTPLPAGGASVIGSAPSGRLG